ncbi:MAG: SAM-dependent chlorinase/fluorinase [Myxococcales bacterium]|nr:SAM-dependent chlorinase/fluorinase [Myxococcales bacterium]
MRAITLLTDYGLADTYVGQLKGAILRIAHEASIVDITHQVPAQDVKAGAFLLWSAVEVFPAGTVHVAVVDPGVGSGRRAIALRAKRGDLFVGPDSGLLVPAAERLGGIEAAVELTRELYWGLFRSTTFHGRDVFGPVAAHLALGAPLEDIGTPIADVDRSASLPGHRTTAVGITGEIVHADAFGNLVTSIPAQALPERFAVRVCGRRIGGGPKPTFASVAPGELLAVIGSSGLLEVSAREASAQQLLGAKRGDPLEVERE